MAAPPARIELATNGLGNDRPCSRVPLERKAVRPIRVRFLGTADTRGRVRQPISDAVAAQP
jgi:hypothetical protein